MRPESAFRLHIHSTARVRDLCNTAPVTLEASLTHAEGKRVVLHCDTALAVSTAVRIDVEGAMLLGEVMQTAVADSGYAIVVRIEQLIPSLTDLAALMQGLFGEAREKRTAEQAAAR